MIKLIPIVFIFLATQVSAQEIKHPIALQNLFTIAMENSPKLQVVKAKILEMESQQQHTQSYQDWEVRLKSELSYSMIENKHFPRTANQLTASYPLYQPDVDSLIESDNFFLEATKLNFEDAKQMLFSEIAESYFQYQIQRIEIKFLEQEQISVRNILEQLNLRLELGQQNLSKVSAEQAELGMIQAGLLAELEKKWQLQVEIETLVNKQVFIESFPVNLQPEILVINSSFEQAVLEHPKLKSLVMQEQALTKKIAYQRQKEGLKLNGFVAAIHNDSNKNFYDDMTAIKAGIKLELPLYIGDRIDANVGKEQAKKQGLHAQFQQLKLVQVLKAKNSYLIYNSSFARIKAIQSSIESYQQVIEAIESGIASGKQERVDLLNAKRLLNRAKKEKKRIKLKIWQNAYKFYSSIGAF